MKKGTSILWSDVMRIPVNRYVISLLVCAGVLIAQPVRSQCPGGYTESKVNWDNLDYYYNSGTGAPYGRGGSPSRAYITDAMEQLQRFAIGKTWVSIATSTNALVTTTENNTHTADVGSYGDGDDVQYNGNGTITLTFGAPVQNLKFSIYDVDRSQKIDFSAADGATPIPITLSAVSGTILSFINNGTTNPQVSASNTTVANTSTDGTVNVDITGPVTTVTLVVTGTTTCSFGCGAGGSENPAVYWLSDITACVQGSFPLNYHQIASSQPFTGPVGNQPQYFLATPDNESVYMVDPATGNGKYLFSDSLKRYVNSFAYDAQNRILYYISENPTADQDNKTLRKYDFNTATKSDVVADITATLGIPTFNMGIESAGAAWYDGALYLGIEGGQHRSNNTTRESIIWRIDFTGSTPTSAYQVFGTPSYDEDGSPSFHDWGDFLIKDGVLVDFNTARRGSPYNYDQSKYHHFDLTTGNVVVYTNPTTIPYAGQGGLAWNGDMYWLRDSVGKYNGDGTMDPTTKRKLVVVPGPKGMGPYPDWTGGNTGDASDPFRPKSDFGDAPASYDPDPQAPATHEIIPDLRLGATVVDEWVHTASAQADAEPSTEENGIAGAYASLDMNATLDYSVDISAFNNTGTPAVLVAWLDYNFNGTFEPGEGVSYPVPSQPASQTISVTWPGIWVQVTTNTQTFMRFRLTHTANGMTTANGMNGWFPDGEVEDWPVVIGDVLPKDIESLALAKKSNSVDVQWSINVQRPVDNFVVMRSNDGVNWISIASIKAQNGFGLQKYVYNDAGPFPGTSYYRVKVNYQANGANKFTEVKSVRFENNSPILKVLPNPATSQAEIQLTAAVRGIAKIEVFDQSGRKLYAQQKNIDAGLNRIALDKVETFTAGMYLVRVSLGGRVMNTKLIINKH